MKKGQFNLHKIAQISCSAGKQISHGQERAGKAEIERKAEREGERISELGINII